MKRIGFILLVLVLSTGFVAAQKKQKGPNPVFVNNVHDFGKVEESAGTVSYVFTFKNEGTEPFIIQRIQTTCGCTTPDYSREPILPGKTGTIKVTYSTTGRPGSFNKVLPIFSNVPDSVYKITVKGEVLRNKR